LKPRSVCRVLVNFHKAFRVEICQSYFIFAIQASEPTQVLAMRAGASLYRPGPSALHSVYQELGHREAGASTVCLDIWEWRWQLSKTIMSLDPAAVSSPQVCLNVLWCQRQVGAARCLYLTNSGNCSWL
jgi:hypothetical protein